MFCTILYSTHCEFFKFQAKRSWTRPLWWLMYRYNSLATNDVLCKFRKSSYSSLWPSTPHYNTSSKQTLILCHAFYTLVPAAPRFMHNWITGQTCFRKQSVKLCRKCLPAINMVAEISSCKRRKTDNAHKRYECQKWMRVPNVISQLS